MKKKALVLLIGILFLSCSKEKLIIRQGDCMPFYISDTYKYPIVPGTDKWKELTSHDKMVAACQIPGSTLKSISTEGLLETLLTLPLIGDVLAFNSPQDGFEAAKAQNIGFSELYSRNDIYKVLSDRYKLMSLDCEINPYPPFTVYPAPKEISFEIYELFFYQDELLNKLTNDQRFQIFKLIYDKYQEKIERGFIYGNTPSIAIMIKIMALNNYPPFVDLIPTGGFGIGHIPFFYLSPTIEIVEGLATSYRGKS